MLPRGSVTRRPPLWFDKAFVSPQFVDSLERESGRPDHGNVVHATGVSIISSGGVPEGTMYVTSSWHGPLFVNGPTVVHFGDGGLEVARYCAAYESADDPPSQDRGFAVRA